MTRKTFEPHPELFDLVSSKFPATQRSPVHCVGCQALYEIYCSEECRQRAWDEFHQVLCPGTNPALAAPLQSLAAFCRDTRRSNPLMVTRIFASVKVKILGGLSPVKQRAPLWITWTVD